jgi:glycosyltransferase involved in cell wall biosynthesis
MTIWLDLTTSERMGGSSRVGITRVESQYASWFLTHAPESVRFCYISQRTERYHSLSHEDARQIVAGAHRAEPPRPARQRSRLRLWISMPERSFRHARRRFIRWLCHRSPTFKAFFEPAIFQADDVLLMAGCTWGWHDLSWLGHLKTQIGMRLVVLCFDLIPAKFPHLFPSAAVPPYMRFLDLMLAKADLIVCISEATSRDLRECAAARGRPLPPNCVVPLGHDLPDLSHAPSRPRLASVEPGRFILCVGTLEIRKNHALLYQVWRRLVEKRAGNVPSLVLAGSIGWHIDKLMYAMQHDTIAASRIVIISGATDADLAWLYRNCLFTVYPSLYEGFGLPIAESLAYGKHCIASSTSAMPEAGAGLARHLDPLDHAAWLAEIESLIEDPTRLEAIEKHIRATYHPVSWEASGRKLFETISGLGSARASKAAA